MKKGIFDELKSRGYIYQMTNEEIIKEKLNNEKVTFYLGIDPTADSLHIGHFFALMMFRRLQRAGHKGILVIGGATALVGDPSGRSDMRQMMSKERAQKNLDEIKNLVSKFIKLDGENPALILDNKEWMDSYSYIDFLRDVGIHFNVNTMLAVDVYAKRLEEGGLTFLEMGYMLMQAYDFVYLNRKYGCTLQIGGSDQWGNIIAGSNLNHKMSLASETKKEEIYGLTCPLLMTKEGNKMGKSAKGTLWVAREKTAVYDFYQYFYNVDDGDVETLLKLFTDLDLKTIDNLLKDDIIKAKRVMAYEITKLVHGKEETDKVLETLKSLFSDGELNLEKMPTFTLKKSYLDSSKNIIDFVYEVKFLPSKSEVRRLITQNGLMINDKKVEDITYLVSKKDLVDNEYIILKKGKKNFLRVLFK